MASVGIISYGSMVSSSSSSGNNKNKNSSGDSKSKSDPSNTSNNKNTNEVNTKPSIQKGPKVSDNGIKTSNSANKEVGKAKASTEISSSSLSSKRLYRTMSESELKAVKETKTLRGGREGTTFFTDSNYKSASKAKERLSLPDTPSYNVEFEITNKPKISGGTRVEPKYGGTGGGREYYTDDKVKVKIINYQKMKK